MTDQDYQSEIRKLRETVRKQNERIAELEGKKKGEPVTPVHTRPVHKKETSDIDKPFKPA